MDKPCKNLILYYSKVNLILLMERINPDNHPNLGVPAFYPAYSRIGEQVTVPVGSEFVVNGLVEELAASRNRFFFHPGLFDELRLEQYMLQSSSFQERPDWRIGREASVQGVYFGELNLTIDTGHSFTFDVACKPYLIARRAAAHEYASFEHIRKLGFIETLQPAGFWVDDSGNVTLLTHMEHDVRSLDNVDWRRRGEDPLSTHLDLFTALEKAAFTLGRYHKNGFIHQDAQVQNMAVGEHGLKAVDLTTLRQVHDPHHPEDYERLFRGMHKDLKDLVGSVYELGFLRGDDEGDRGRVLRTALLTPYKSMVLHPSSGIDPELTAMLEASCDDILTAV